jgi:hypothetical protein
VIDDQAIIGDGVNLLAERIGEGIAAINWVGEVNVETL